MRRRVQEVARRKRSNGWGWKIYRVKAVEMREVDPGERGVATASAVLGQDNSGVAAKAGLKEPTIAPSKPYRLLPHFACGCEA